MTGTGERGVSSVDTLDACIFVKEQVRLFRSSSISSVFFFFTERHGRPSACEVRWQKIRLVLQAPHGARNVECALGRACATFWCRHWCSRGRLI